MKTILGVALLFASSCIVAQEAIILPIIEVHDGDTIKTSLTLPAPLDAVSVRINGIDTPEIPAASYAITGKLGRAKCVKEAELALKAKQFVVDLIGTTQLMTLTMYKWGKYGGRMVSNVVVNGKDISVELINAGLAVPYDGGTKTKDWCN